MNQNFRSRWHRASAGAIGGAVALLLSGQAPAQAQQTELEALRAQIEELTARLGKLEQQQQDTADAAKKASPAVTSRLPVTVSGLFQVQANSFNGEDGNVFPRQANTFRLRRGEVRITAPTITPRISGTMQLDFAKFVTNAGTAPFAVNAASNVLQEIQLSYLLRKGAPPTSGGGPANNIYLDFGQFKIPIGYEGPLVSSSALQTVERALLFRARDVANGGAGDVRDTGIQLRGTAGQLEYRLGVFNGLGERQNALSTSDRKAVVGSLIFSPKSISGLQVGLSAGKGDTGNLPVVAGGPVTQQFDRDLVDAFVVYKKNKLTLIGEYLTGNSENNGVVGVGGARRELQGYYANVGYAFTPKIEGVLRYDYFNFDRRTPGNLETAVRELTAGVNYYIKGNNAKIQANIVRVQGGEDLTAANGFGGGTQGQGFQNDRTELRVQGQVAF